MAALWTALEEVGLKDKARSKKLPLDSQGRRVVYMEVE